MLQKISPNFGLFYRNTADHELERKIKTYILTYLLRPLTLSPLCPIEELFLTHCCSCSCSRGRFSIGSGNEANSVTRETVSRRSAAWRRDLWKTDFGRTASSCPVRPLWSALNDVTFDWVPLSAHPHSRAEACLDFCSSNTHGSSPHTHLRL